MRRLPAVAREERQASEGGLIGCERGESMGNEFGK
jgi:hypothetical protein